MSTMLIYSPNSTYIRILSEALEEKTLHARTQEAVLKLLKQTLPALLLIDASHTAEAEEIPAYLADMEQFLTKIPVILLVPKESENVEVPGSCDIVILPVTLQELQSRIAQKMEAESITIDHNITFIPARREIIEDGGIIIKLTEKEADILEYMFKSRNITHRKETLLKALWGYADNVDSRTLETHIYRLRSKLEELPGNGISIVSEEGGYRIQ